MSTSYIDPQEAVALGARLRLARKKIGATVVELAERTGVSHSQISRIERGLFKGTSKNVHILCVFLAVDQTQASSTNDPQQLALRIERLASRSTKWRNVVAAFLEALEAAQNAIPPRN